MAILSAMPEQAIISAFKGCVDFYEWRGLPCARMWPTWPKREPHPDERVNQEYFAFINKNLALLPDYVIDQYKRQVAGTPFTWKDLVVQAYMKGIPY